MANTGRSTPPCITVVGILGAPWAASVEDLVAGSFRAGVEDGPNGHVAPASERERTVMAVTGRDQIGVPVLAAQGRVGGGLSLAQVRGVGGASALDVPTGAY